MPRPVPGIDIRSLPLTPLEAFVLSRIDGVIQEHELMLVTGLAPDQTEAALSRLRELGVIDVEGGAAPSAQVSLRAAPTARSAPAPAAPPAPQPKAPAAEAPRLYDPAELEEDVEINLDRKRAILELFHRLDELSYYELLGVEPSADKKEIKRAYYELAPEFHPDKYFRKRLGSYKTKIEIIFSRVTAAHDVLTHKARRAEYDAYLEQVVKNRAMAAWMERAPRSSTPAGMSAPPPSTPPREPPPSQPDAREALDPAAAAEIDRVRRQALARKLSGGFRRVSTSGGVAAPPSSAPTPRLPVPPGRASSIAMELEHHLRAADAAEARADFVAAADALRAALALAPSDRALEQRCYQAEERATTTLAEGYLKQADYEAGEGRWAEASWSYAKAASLLPSDPRAHERVAFATLVTGGSPVRALEFARRAVELAPGDVLARLTLARAHFAAGLEKGGLAELEEARLSAAGDPRLEAMVADFIEQIRRRGRG